MNKQFLGGLAFNRRHFHTNIDACIMCVMWSGLDDNIEEIKLYGFDITDDGNLSESVCLPVKRVHNLFSTKYYDKSIFPDTVYNGILTGLNGLEAEKNVKRRIKPLYNSEMIGYMVADSVGFDNPDAKSSLLIAGRYNGNGFYLYKSNYLSKLPMFCASRYITYNREWTERARIMKSADGAEHYSADVSNGKLHDFLLKCLLFTCLEMQNHMRTFKGSDGRFYKNELCLDGTNGETLAVCDLRAMRQNKEEATLFSQWEMVLSYAKETENYNPILTYGVYQIYAELDTFHKDEKTDKIIWDNVELHSALQSLKGLVKAYYNTEIVPTLFEYEFLK